MYIAASAGSGKTYQLVNRYVALLSLQMLESGRSDVSRLIAVTFTRKASGEFKERILAALAEAAQSEQAAKNFWKTRIHPVICDEQTGICPGVQLQEPLSLLAFFKQMLRELTNDFSRLNLSTIDSFFQQMVTALSPELGLGSSSTMDDAQLSSCNRSTLDFSYLSTAEQDAGVSALEEAFRVLCPREQEREAPDVALLKLVKDYHERVLDTPHAQWGGIVDDMSDEQLALFGLCQQDVTPPMDEAAFRAAMDTLYHCLAEQQQQDPKTPKNIATYIHSLADREGNIAPRPASKKWKSYVERCQQQGVNVDDVAGVRRAGYWRRMPSRTAALRRIILEFEKHYDSNVRARGRHVFGDIPRLLQEHADEESLLSMQERTDAQLDHWMLDEFQDTSHSQYAVLKDLLANRVSSDTGSVFMVGDAKQSIYQFRGGDPQIFLDVRQQLLGIRDEGHSESVQKPLDTSYRSSAEVLEFSNDLFYDIDRMATLAGEEARENWKKLNYQRHLAAACNAGMPGCAAVYEVSTEELSAQEKRERMYDALAALLAQNRPAAAGEAQPTCAILVRKNQEAEAIYSALTARQHTYGFAGPIVVCNDCKVGSDSPAGLALMQLFRWLNCPADEKSLSQLRLSPLWETLCADICGAPAAETRADRQPQIARIWNALKRQLSAEGVSGVLRLLVRRCPALRCNAFMRQRISLWLTAADAFDGKGGTLSEWLTSAEELTLREEPQGNPIRIMTTFQAKGLEYDMVLLPQLNGESMADYGKARLLTRQDAQGRTCAVLLPPSSDMLDSTPTVRAALYAPWLAEQEFAEFCILYVAVTRARHATYVIIPRKNTTGESVTNMMHQLAAAHPECAPVDGEQPNNIPALCLYQRGNRHWHNDWLEQQQNTAGESANPPELPQLDFHFPSLIRSTPSGRAAAQKKQHAAVQNLPVGQCNNGANFGTLVHSIFELVGWLEPGEHPELPQPNNAEERDAQAAVQRALATPAVRALFTKPSTPCRLLREQGIEALRERRVWISGQIDRLVIEYADTACKQPLRAHIIDFKSDRCEAAALKPDYARQMREYRDMVALALALPLESVSVTLIHAPRVGPSSIQPYGAEEL